MALSGLKTYTLLDLEVAALGERGELDDDIANDLGELSGIVLVGGNGHDDLEGVLDKRGLDKAGERGADGVGQDIDGLDGVLEGAGVLANDPRGGGENLAVGAEGAKLAVQALILEEVELRKKIFVNFIYFLSSWERKITISLTINSRTTLTRTATSRIWLDSNLPWLAPSVLHSFCTRLAS